MIPPFLHHKPKADGKVDMDLDDIERVYCTQQNTKLSDIRIIAHKEGSKANFHAPYKLNGWYSEDVIICISLGSIF